MDHDEPDMSYLQSLNPAQLLGQFDQAHHKQTAFETTFCFRSGDLSEGQSATDLSRSRIGKDESSDSKSSLSRALLGIEAMGNHSCKLWS